MAKAHASLSPITNILLIFVWAGAAAFFLIAAQPRVPLALALAGAVLGAIAGVMQHLSFVQATAGFTAATTLMEVRRAFAVTTWGRRYIRFLYTSKIILIALAVVLVRQPLAAILFGSIAAYFSLMFAREIVTLRDSFQLLRLSANVPGNEPDAA